MSFLGTALWKASPVGLAITGLVYVVYKVALTYEECVSTFIGSGLKADCADS